MTDPRIESARLLKHLILSLSSPEADRSDIAALAAKIKRAPGDDDFTKLARDTAAKAIRWAYFRGDEQALLDSAHILLRALDPNVPIELGQ